VQFSGPITAVQDDAIGKLRVTFTLCALGYNDGDDPDPENPDHPGCGDGQSGADNGTYQILLGFRVPSGTGAPTTFVSGPPAPKPPAGDPVTFTRNADYSRELQRLAPAPAGFTWIGYLSSPYVFDQGADDVPAQSGSVTVPFDLPPGPGGAPFDGPFPVRPVVGYRVAGIPTSQGVSCGDSLFESFSTRCVADPIDALDFASNLAFDTADLGVVPPPAANANPGQRLSLPFQAKVAGSLPDGTTVAVSAGTNLPGFTPQPSRASFAPSADSTTLIDVPVVVPANAGPGTFDVSLTAALPNGQKRTGTAKLTILDKQKPVVSRFRLRPASFRPSAPAITAAGARVRYTSSEPATLRLSVQRCRKVRRKTRCKTIRRSGFSHAARKGANSFRVTGFVRNKALRRGSYKLVGTPVDAAKNRGKKVSAKFRIRR
jgi:hypothetical protein